MEIKNLPDKLRLFVLNEETRNVAPGVILSATLVLRITNLRLGQIESELIKNIHLGVLASDHVGYISFDLKPLKNYSLTIERISDLSPDFEARIETDEIYVASPIRPTFRFDLYSFLVDLTDIREFVQLVDLLPGSIPVLLPSELAILSNNASKGIQSIRNPDVLDWKISPESFGMAGLPAIGEDGCETLLPSQSTDRIFKFHQLIRFPALNNEVLNSSGGSLEFKRGKLIEYEMLWHPINHGLGQVQYSLTLAPGESTNIAVIDWDRKDESVREERTGVNESLLHEQKRNRIIEEAVEATIKEYQRGNTFMGGTAGVGGYGGQGQGSMWGVTGSHSLGYAELSSTGERNLASQSAQQLGDTIAQASSMMRDLRSTVIIQANQTERNELQTRNIRNYNHSHALTILYYEVVRHYCIITRPIKEQDVLFIRYSPRLFDISRVRRYQKILKENLIEKSLLDNFSLINASIDEEEERIDLLLNGEINKFIIRITQGNDPMGAAFDRHRLLILTKNGDILFSQFRNYGVHFSGDTVNAAFITYSFFIEGSGDPFIDANLKLEDIAEIGISFNKEGGLGGEERFGFKKLEIKVVVEYRATRRLLTLAEYTDIPAQNVAFQEDTEWWAFPNRLPNIRLEHNDYLIKRSTINDLITHLNINLNFYNAIIWLSESPNDRLINFENFPYRTSDTPPLEGRLSDFINPQPIDIFGHYIAFRIGEVKSIPEEEIEVSEKIVSMPTRGLFAEAQLSHCNASEIIDDSRFWDWQSSPIPDSAPEITGTSPTSRYNSIIGTPTGMPERGIGIDGKSDVPNPSALSAIIESVTKGDIFRDMSAKEQLASVLNELTKAAADVEKQRMQSLTELGKQDAETERARLNSQASQIQNRNFDSASSSSGNDTVRNPNPSNSTSTPRNDMSTSENPGNDTPTARDTSTDIAMVRREINDPQQQQEIVERVLERRTAVSSSQRRISLDLKYGAQDLNGFFGLHVANRSQNRRGSDTEERNNRSAETPEGGSSSLTVSIPPSWTEIRVSIRISSLIFLNHSLLDSRSQDFLSFLRAQSTGNSIFNLNMPDSGNRLYDYVVPITVSRVISIQDSMSRNLVCRFRILTDEIQVERTISSSHEDEWNMSGNLSYEGKIILSINGGNTTTNTRETSTVVQRTLRVSYIDPQQPILSQGSESDEIE